MRIGIDCRMYRREMAGIGRYIRELLHALFCLDKVNEYVLFMTAKDAREFEVDRERWSVSGKFKSVVVEIPHYSLKEQTILPKIIKDENLDLVHYPNFNHPLFCRIPFVATIHDLIYLRFPGRTMNCLVSKLAYKQMNKHIARKASKIIFVSEYTRQDFLKHFPCDERKTRVVFEAASTNDRGSGQGVTPVSFPVDLAKNCGQAVFLYVGAWRPHKNLEFLIEAFSEVVKKIPAAKLVIAGKVDLAFPKIPAKVKSLGLGDSVIFTGFVHDQQLDKLFDIATAFVFPSLYEGFGLPPLEAAAKGVPVICSNRTSLPEVMGEGAIYADPENVQEWSEAMIRIVEDKSLRGELIKKGLEQVCRFSWEKTAMETLRVYHQVVGKKD